MDFEKVKAINDRVAELKKVAITFGRYRDSRSNERMFELQAEIKSMLAAELI